MASDDDMVVAVHCERPATWRTEVWDDPGDYPSGQGAGPLPSEKHEVLHDGGRFHIYVDELRDIAGLTDEQRSRVRVCTKKEGDEVIAWFEEE